MKILRIIWIIIEFIIAIAIFIILAQKTPLFERIVSSMSSTPSIQTTANLTWDTVEKKNTLTNTGTILKTGAQSTTNSEPIPVEVYSSGRWCTTPRWQQLSDNQSVTAYTSSSSSTTNICNSELRVCRKGKLSGSYAFKICSFVVDGRRNGKDIITGASISDQKIGDGAVKLQAYLAANKEYIQPKETKRSDSLKYTDTQPYPMENSENISYNDNRPDFLDQQWLRHPHNNEGTWSCTSPRWETVRHGSFVYAYDIDTSTIQQTCKLEKRACINGKLSGTYTKKSCDDNISQKNKTSDTLQSLARKENDRLWKIVDPIVDNGMISPWGPVPTHLSDSIRDSIILSKYGRKGIWKWPNPMPQPTHHHYDTIDNNQNYIALSSCITPRWSPLQHGQHVTAYRNQAVEWNSLCDSQTRTCRDGKLRWSFQYKSCNPNTKPIKKKNSRYPGKIILDTTETVIDTVEHTSKSVWDWVRDLFR